ncbi:restriction endonuclease subunit S [Microbulbifer sp. MLAF003]|uniref:restriction endonuclease subunit S n=1 Tax=Microbulbifer sp. MLAF003 TaxID=3032582 RepID=UPI0024AC9A65|nr:restriction endonuclease subunit S [Microbulbifer sp. MLAF003]WHI49573.1 restriction endonuclease subunit S [Microbulbifer sp. MLAF003]
MVPKGWDVKKLEELALVERGKFSARPRNDPRFFGGKVPFVQTGDVSSSGTYLKAYSQTLNEDGVGVSRVFPSETILITIAANIGDTAITCFDVACPDSIVAIQPNPTIANVYWLKKLLETKKEDLDSKSTQNAQKNINLQVLKPLSLLTPPLPEQKKIAQILSTWDKAIDTSEKLLANSRQQKKALMQQLLTGKKRLRDKNGVRFSGEWKKAPIKNLVEIVYGKSPKEVLSQNGKNPIYGTGGISGHAIEPLCTKTSVLIGRKGTIDKPIYIDRPFWAIDTTFYCLPKQNTHIKWFYYLVSMLGLKKYSEASGVPSLSRETLYSIKVFTPTSLEEQQKIAATLSSADREIETLQQKLDCLKQEKKALMQQLLTGKRRVQVENAQ